MLVLASVLRLDKKDLALKRLGSAWFNLVQLSSIWLSLFFSLINEPIYICIDITLWSTWLVFLFFYYFFGMPELWSRVCFTLFLFFACVLGLVPKPAELFVLSPYVSTLTVRCDRDREFSICFKKIVST